MTIKRAAPGQNPFTIVLNEVINDQRLGADALGMLVYLISKPASWSVQIGDLRNQFGMGRDKAYKLLSHLVDLGYAQRYQERTGSGGFSDNNYLIFDRINPLPENPETAPLPELPYAVDQTLQKKERKKTKEDSYSEDFEALWKQYPRTKNSPKKDAWNRYRMLNAERQEMVRRAVPLFAAAMRAENRPEDKIKHMVAWIHSGMYETASAPAAGAASGAPANDVPFWKRATREQWGRVLDRWRETERWSASWGPDPDQSTCKVPADMLAAHNLKYRRSLFRQADLERFEVLASKQPVDTTHGPML